MAVVHHTSIILQFIGYPISLALWNTFQNGFFRVEIILHDWVVKAFRNYLGVDQQSQQPEDRNVCISPYCSEIDILNLIRNAALLMHNQSVFCMAIQIFPEQGIRYSVFFGHTMCLQKEFALIYLVAFWRYPFQLNTALVICGALVQSY
jgi:hypothetical protein